MSIIVSDQQTVGMLNRVFMAYFLNIAEDYGVDFVNTRPTESITKSMVGHYFVPDVDYAHLRHFHIGKIHIEDISLKKLQHCHIEEWLDKYIKNKIHYMAKEFSEVSSRYPYSDYIFSMLPDFNPFLSQCCTDIDTGFTARIILAPKFSDYTHYIIFEFYCLIIERWRKVEDDPIFGQKYQIVSSMTPEEREKFDKQPEKKEDE